MPDCYTVWLLNSLTHPLLNCCLPARLLDCLIAELFARTASLLVCITGLLEWSWLLISHSLLIKAVCIGRSYTESLNACNRDSLKYKYTIDGWWDSVVMANPKDAVLVERWQIGGGGIQERVVPLLTPSSYRALCHQTPFFLQSAMFFLYLVATIKLSLYCSWNFEDFEGWSHNFHSVKGNCMAWMV